MLARPLVSILLVLTTYAAALPTTLSTTLSAAQVATFEGLPLPGSESQYNGDPGGLLAGQSHDGSFISGGATFNNVFAIDAQFNFPFWNGWSYSNRTDRTTPGFGNQYSSFPGGGASASSQYAVAFVGGFPAPQIELPAGFLPRSVELTNTTYAALSIRDGDPFAKKFGDNPATFGVVETDFPDFFLLQIGGIDASGQTLPATVEVALADYRAPSDGEDYILDSWKSVDLTPLSGARRLTFQLSSSDNGPFGMNTPAYFALDNLLTEAIPEPTGWLLFVLFAIAGGAWTQIGRWRRPT